LIYPSGKRFRNGMIGGATLPGRTRSGKVSNRSADSASPDDLTVLEHDVLFFHPRLISSWTNAGQDEPRSPVKVSPMRYTFPVCYASAASGAARRPRRVVRGATTFVSGLLAT
jgi:hypothetical protein